MTHKTTRHDGFPHRLAVRVRAPRKNRPKNGSLMLSQPLCTVLFDASRSATIAPMLVRLTHCEG